MKNAAGVLLVASVMTAAGVEAADSVDFGFDLSGAGLGSGFTPVGSWSWEQSLPSYQYARATDENGTLETRQYATQTLLRTGLGEATELQLGWDGYIREKTTFSHQPDQGWHSGQGDLSVGVKHLLKTASARTSYLVAGTITIPTGNKAFREDDASLNLAGAVVYTLSERAALVTTFAVDLSEHENALQFIPTVEYALSERMGSFIELISEKAEGESAVLALAGGLSYSINERMQIDLTAGRGVDLPAGERERTLGLSLGYLF